MNRWVEQTLATNYQLRHTLCRIVMHADSNCNLLFHFKTIFLKWLRFILTDLRFQVMWCLSMKTPFCTRNLTTNQLYYKLQITTSFRNNSTRYLNEKKGEFSMCLLNENWVWLLNTHDIHLTALSQWSRILSFQFSFFFLHLFWRIEQRRNHFLRK